MSYKHTFLKIEPHNMLISAESLEPTEEVWDPMSEDYYSPMNTVALNTENYDSVTTGYIPKDETKICRFFRNNGSCYKGRRRHIYRINR